MDVIATVFTTVTGLAGLFIASHVWWKDRRLDRERQARRVSAWVVREGRERMPKNAEELRGVVICNNSDAPIAQVGVRMIAQSVPEHRDLLAKDDADTDVGADPGQMFAQIPPGSYYLQRNDDPEQPWSAPQPVDSQIGGLTVSLDSEQVRLVPVTEVPAEFRLAFVGFRDTFDRQWWRVEDGHLTDDPPGGWDIAALRRTARRDLAPPRRRGRSEATEAIATLLRQVVNLAVSADQRVDVSKRAMEDVSTSGSSHPLATHVTGVGLAGMTGMGVRLLTTASRSKNVYYLEGNRDGFLPVQFFYGDVVPDRKVTNLKTELLSRGSARAEDWTPEGLATALAEVIDQHQSSLTRR